jgi:hypothetical protein
MNDVNDNQYITVKYKESRKGFEFLRQEGLHGLLSKAMTKHTLPPGDYYLQGNFLHRNSSNNIPMDLDEDTWEVFLERVNVNSDLVLKENQCRERESSDEIVQVKRPKVSSASGEVLQYQPTFHTTTAPVSSHLTHLDGYSHGSGKSVRSSTKVIHTVFGI